LAGGSTSPCRSAQAAASGSRRFRGSDAESKVAQNANGMFVFALPDDDRCKIEGVRFRRT
jgi:hypothetical protein